MDNPAQIESPSPEKVPYRLRLEHILLLVFLLTMLLAGAGLLLLKDAHQRQARYGATEAVLHRGIALLNSFCGQDAADLTASTPERWRQFSRAADTVFAVRPDVQSLSITRNGVTVFQRQAQGLDAADSKRKMPLEDASTELSFGTVEIAGKPQPVFLISRTLTAVDGGKVVVEATLKREAVSEEEQRAREQLASLFFFSLTVLGLAFTGCAILLIVAILRDRSHEQRARQEEHLAFSGVLANGILHDFRNPMSAVRLDAQMLEREMNRTEGFRKERVQELSGRIARTMNRMDKIFHEFLFLAKPADEKTESLHVEQVIQECIETLAPRIEQADVRINVDLPPTLPAVSAFPFAIRRAVLNVLVNALQFAPKGSTVDIHLTETADAVQTDILDRGPGIPPQMRKRIFDLFVTTRPEGTGLGLFLARTAIQRCNGTIEALAREGGGTCFRITLRKATTP